MSGGNPTDPRIGQNPMSQSPQPAGPYTPGGLQAASVPVGNMPDITTRTPAQNPDFAGRTPIEWTGGNTPFGGRSPYSQEMLEDYQANPTHWDWTPTHTDRPPIYYGPEGASPGTSPRHPHGWQGGDRPEWRPPWWRDRGDTADTNPFGSWRERIQQRRDERDARRQEVRDFWSNRFNREDMTPPPWRNPRRRFGR